MTAPKNAVRPGYAEMIVNLFARATDLIPRSKTRMSVGAGEGQAL